MELNNWQIASMRKYDLEESDIAIIKKDWIDTKNFKCNSCDKWELLGFIDMYEQNCRLCGKKKIVKAIEVRHTKVEDMSIALDSSILYDTQPDIAEWLWKGISTIKRMINRWEIIKVGNKYKLA